MTSDGRDRWGVGLLAVCLVFGAAIIALVVAEVGANDPRSRRISFLAITLLSAFTAAWAGRSSYPRVQNLKIYTFGVGASAIVASVALSGAAVLAVAGGQFQLAVRVGSATAYIMLLALILAGTVVPEAADFRTTARVGLILAIAGAALPALVMLVGSVRALGATVASELTLASRSPALVALFGLALGAIFLTLVRERRSLGLGGWHAGLALLVVLGVLLLQRDAWVSLLTLATIALAGSAGIVIQWMRRLENRAAYDPLMRIYNRGYCQSVIDGQSRVDLSPPSAIAICDIDHFKSVNDTHGHDAGDEVLRVVARRLQDAVIPQGIVGRWGGEEIIVFLPGRELDEARDIIEGARLAIASSPVDTGSLTVGVTISAGVAARGERAHPLDRVITAADRALYAAKQGGRNQVRTSRLRRAEEAHHS